MTSQFNAFAWRTGEPSVFMADKQFTSTPKTVAANAKKLGTAFIEIPDMDSINTEAQDRIERPKQKGRAL